MYIKQRAEGVEDLDLSTKCNPSRSLSLQDSLQLQLVKQFVCSKQEVHHASDHATIHTARHHYS